MPPMPLMRLMHLMRPTNTFEIHTDLPLWVLYAVEDLMKTIANITGRHVHFAIITESPNDQTAQSAT